MQTAQSIAQIRAIVLPWRACGERVGLVPTMGCLHDGHLELVRQARIHCTRVVTTIFVNPLQFGEEEDLAQYPRDVEGDAARLSRVGSHALFAPAVAEMYPRPLKEMTQVRVPGLSGILCGMSRPVHFGGVTTIVGKLFNIVQPDMAFFGEKDFQQLVIIQRMTRDLAFPVEVMGVPTVREPNGLAMSSRNAYLDRTERQLAPRLYLTLCEAVKRLRDGYHNMGEVAEQAKAALRAAGFRPDYVSIRRRVDLAEARGTDRELVILAAAWLGRARLIDNVPFDL